MAKYYCGGKTANPTEERISGMFHGAHNPPMTTDSECVGLWDFFPLQLQTPTGQESGWPTLKALEEAGSGIHLHAPVVGHAHFPITAIECTLPKLASLRLQSNPSTAESGASVCSQSEDKVGVCGRKALLLPWQH